MMNCRDIHDSSTSAMENQASTSLPCSGIYDMEPHANDVGSLKQADGLPLALSDDASRYLQQLGVLRAQLMDYHSYLYTLEGFDDLMERLADKHGRMISSMIKDLQSIALKGHGAAGTHHLEYEIDAERPWDEVEQSDQGLWDEMEQSNHQGSWDEMEQSDHPLTYLAATLGLSLPATTVLYHADKDALKELASKVAEQQTEMESKEESAQELKALREDLREHREREQMLSHHSDIRLRDLQSQMTEARTQLARLECLSSDPFNEWAAPAQTESPTPSEVPTGRADPVAEHHCLLCSKPTPFLEVVSSEARGSDQVAEHRCRLCSRPTLFTEARGLDLVEHLADVEPTTLQSDADSCQPHDDHSEAPQVKSHPHDVPQDSGDPGGQDEVDMMEQWVSVPHDWSSYGLQQLNHMTLPFQGYPLPIGMKNLGLQQQLTRDDKKTQSGHDGIDVTVESEDKSHFEPCPSSEAPTGRPLQNQALMALLHQEAFLKLCSLGTVAGLACTCTISLDPAAAAYLTSRTRTLHRLWTVLNGHPRESARGYHNKQWDEADSQRSSSVTIARRQKVTQSPDSREDRETMGKIARAWSKTQKSPDSREDKETMGRSERAWSNTQKYVDERYAAKARALAAAQRLIINEGQDGTRDKKVKDDALCIEDPAMRDESASARLLEEATLRETKQIGAGPKEERRQQGQRCRNDEAASHKPPGDDSELAPIACQPES